MRVGQGLCRVLVLLLILGYQLVSPAIASAFDVRCDKTQVAQSTDPAVPDTLNHLAVWAMKASGDESRRGTGNDVRASLGDAAEGHGPPVDVAAPGAGRQGALDAAIRPMFLLVGTRWSTGPPSSKSI